jgi:hypothetical protein
MTLGDEYTQLFGISGAVNYFQLQSHLQVAYTFLTQIKSTSLKTVPPFPY